VATHFEENIGSQVTAEGNAFEVARKVIRGSCFFGDKIGM